MFGKTVLALFLLVLNTGAWALDPIYTPWHNNNAIKGYDPVAYHLKNEAVKGSNLYTFEWQGATWLFSSASNQQMFISNPEKYAPQYGGYCAYAVAKNTTASIDPTQFSVIDGKLYLNYNKKIQKTWLEHPDDYIKKANENWPSLLK